MNNKKWLLGLCILLLIPLSFAYYPNQTIQIPALYMENNVPTSVYANITIIKPNYVIDINNKLMTEYEIGKFNYTYTFPDFVGSYKAEVIFYNSTNDVQGVVQDLFQVSYNYTDTLNNISSTVQENKGVLENIWDWIQVTIFDSKDYVTSLIGKISAYEQIVFKTELNYYPSSCEININDNIYNMTVVNKFAYYYFYIPDTGEYNWSVNCT